MRRIGPYSKAASVRMLDFVNHLVALQKVDNLREFCTKSGIPISSIARWRNGNGIPTIEDIGACNRIWGLSIEWLILGKGTMFGQRDLLSELAAIEKELIRMASEAKKLRQK